MPSKRGDCNNGRYHSDTHTAMNEINLMLFNPLSFACHITVCCWVAAIFVGLIKIQTKEKYVCSCAPAASTCQMEVLESCDVTESKLAHDKRKN